MPSATLDTLLPNRLANRMRNARRGSSNITTGAMNTAKLAGFPLGRYYKLDLNDDKVFQLLNKKRYSGIFQFDGQALGIVTNQMGIQSFDDMVAVTALSRPGALNSGGTDNYIRINEGEKEPEYYGEAYERITKNTNGMN